MRDHLGVFSMGADLKFSRSVLMLDDCEGTFDWTSSGDGSDFVADHAAVKVWSGTNAIRLKTRTTGAAHLDTVRIVKVRNFPTSGLVVWRSRINLADVSLVSGVQLWMSFNDGANAYAPIVTIDSQTPSITYTNAAGGTSTLAGSGYPIEDYEWLEVEVRYDLDGLMWQSVEIAGVVYDLSSVALYATGAVTKRNIAINYRVYAEQAGIPTVYVDNIYIGAYGDV